MDSDLPGDLTADDRLFNTAGPSELQAKGMWEVLRDYHYVAGFQRAAEVLVEHAARQRSDVDALTVPTLFCYRQWIELRFKDLWMQSTRLDGRSAEPLLTHNLLELWRRVRPVIEEIWPASDREPLDHLERVIDELSQLDGPQGTGFRYAFNRQGRESLSDDVQINLHNVRVVMGKVSVLLDGAAEGLSAMLEHQADMRAEYGGDF